MTCRHCQKVKPIRQAWLKLLDDLDALSGLDKSCDRVVAIESQLDELEKRTDELSALCECWQ